MSLHQVYLVVASLQLAVFLVKLGLLVVLVVRDRWSGR